MEEGVKSGSIANARSIVTRGVFVDIPRARGHEYLEPGDFVRPEEIEAAADQFESGDAAIIRTGATLAPGRPPLSQGLFGYRTPAAGHPLDPVALCVRSVRNPCRTVRRRNRSN